MAGYKGILDFDEDENPFRQQTVDDVRHREITVATAHLKKLTLEREIMKLIQVFEEETELSVGEVILLRGSDNGEKIAGVEVFVAL